MSEKLRTVMMSSIEEIIEFTSLLVQTKTGNSLTYLQNQILQESLNANQKTYAQIAQENNYSENYIKQFVAPKLWKLLSQVLEEKVKKTNCRILLEQRFKKSLLESCSLSLASQQRLIESPEGQVPLASSLYIERSAIEDNCYQEILHKSAFIRIKAPQKMGKTSLMVRILAEAEKKNYYTVRLSLHRAGTQVFADVDRFFRWFCANVTRQLGLESKLDDSWDEDIGALVNCTIYFQSYLLKAISSPVVLALDEVNQLFDYPHLARDFFALLRSWYEETKDIYEWQKLRMVIAHSTEVYIPLKTNKSPFNVGLAIELPPFTATQVEDLAQRQGLKLKRFELERLMELTGGFPYLVRLAFFQTLVEKNSLEKILQQAITDKGIYHKHLHEQLWNLQQNPRLAEGFGEVLIAPKELDIEVGFKLKSLGLVNLEGSEATVSCGLYREYFRYCCLFDYLE